MIIKSIDAIQDEMNIIIISFEDKNTTNDDRGYFFWRMSKLVRDNANRHVGEYIFNTYYQESLKKIKEKYPYKFLELELYINRHVMEILDKNTDTRLNYAKLIEKCISTLNEEKGVLLNIRTYMNCEGDCGKCKVCLKE